MRNGKLRGLLITVMLLVFLAGLASILYPYIWGAAVDSSIANTAKDFLEREEPELPTTTVIIDSIEPEKVKPYPELWEDMVRYNQSIAAQGQSGLSCAYDYQKASCSTPDIRVENRGQPGQEYQQQNRYEQATQFTVSHSGLL